MKTAFIGCGAMGGAIARGLATADATQRLAIFDANQQLANQVAEEVGATPAASPKEALHGADVVLLAVKPQVQSAVITEIAADLDAASAVVSIAAGRTLDAISADFQAAGRAQVPLVRVMPNVNAQVGAAMSALTANEVASAAQKTQVELIFNAIGSTIWLPETQFSIFTALAGSSPAWFYQIIDDLARAGLKHGLTKAQATEIAAQAMLGSAKMLQTQLHAGVHPAEMVDRVCSPAGTTIAGLLAAQHAGLGPALVQAVDATVARDRELGK